MKNMKMKHGVILGIVFLVILNILLVLITTVTENDIKKKDALVINEMSVVHNLKSGQIYHVNWNKDLKELIENNSPFNWEVDSRQCEFSKWITNYLVSGDYTKLPSDIKLQLSMVKQYHLELHSAAQDTVNNYNQGNKETALSLNNNEVKNSLSNLMNTIDQTETAILTQVDANKDIIADLTKNTNLFSLLTIIISLIAAGMVIAFLLKVTFQPLSELINKIKSMNDKEIYQEIGDIQSSYEMGSLLYVFNNMIRKVNSQQVKLQDQNEELVAQGEELAAQNEELTAQEEELIDQNKKILEQQAITEEALDKAQELDKLKSEMINTVSHELRTPLASILGFTELMLKKSPNEVKSKKYLTTIYSEAERLKLLINDFLDLQKIETGRFEFTMQQVSITEILQDCIGLYEGQGNEKHQISLQIDEALPLVMTDPDRVAQVVGNLLSNAIKYSPKGGPVNITASYYDASHIIISIKDCGLGIPEEAMNKLFQPFYRVDNSDRREIGGTGLGLAICYKIIKALDGQIWVESVHGEGSTFSITLPSLDIPEIREDKPVMKEEVIKNQSNFILIVEDDKSLGSLLSEALMDEGYETAVVDNGPSTLSFLENQVPQAIILDIILIGPMDGWEVLRRIKLNEKTRNIPVIISSSIDQKKRMEYKVEDYLVKPFAPEKLIKSINSILQEKSGSVGIPRTEKEPNTEGKITQLLNDNGFTVRDIKKDQHVFVTYIVPDASDK